MELNIQTLNADFSLSKRQTIPPALAFFRCAPNVQLKWALASKLAVWSPRSEPLADDRPMLSSALSPGMTLACASNRAQYKGRLRFDERLALLSSNQNHAHADKRKLADFRD
jgi:hypothetical protein